jgi:dihydrofolate reductase
MRDLVVNEFLTLDGVMQAPGGQDEDRSGGFEHGGWQQPYFDDVFATTIDEGLAETGGFLLGRRTWEIFAAYWPTAPAEVQAVAEPLNTLPKYVATRTLREPLSWNNSSVIAGDVAEGVRQLKAEAGKDVHVFGSGDLVQTLIRNDLVDEYRLMIHPVVLGTGARLFRDGTPRRPLTLADVKPSTTGVLITTYRPAGK